MEQPLIVIATFACALQIFAATHQKKPLYIGCMSPMTGKSAWWGRGIPVAAEIAFGLINNRKDILPGYEFMLLANDTQGNTGQGNKILYDYLSKKQVVMILGPARSNVALSVASTSMYWNLIQVSASATHSDLSSSKSYPYFFRTIPSLGAMRKTFLTLARRFHWTRIAILFYNRDMQAQAARELREELTDNNITILSYGSYFDGDDADTQIKHLKALDVRVVFGFLQLTTSVICKIYRHGLYGRKYAWVINTPDNKTTWWRRTYPSLPCTEAQIYKAAEYTISLDDMLFGMDTDQGVSGLTTEEFQKMYTLHSQYHGLRTSLYGALAFDAAWLMALALNSSAQELGPNSSLENFHYMSESMSDVIKRNLLKIEFVGATGVVHLKSNGDRYGNFEIFQVQGNSIKLIAKHETLSSNFTLLPGQDFVWRDGRPPLDHVTIVPQLVEFSRVGFILVCAFASCGILMSLGFLYFNIKFREKRFIKMSSPNLNNLIIVGCVLAYVSVVLFCVDGDKLSDLICQVRVFTLDIGFTLAFGAMFSKAWRVHKITRKLRLKRRYIKDVHLVAMVMIMLSIDIIILVTWLQMDPLTRDYKWLNRKSHSASQPDVIFQYRILHCKGENVFIWLVIIYGFKVLLLLFGLFLVWETRKVKITELNDSQHIGMAVYNVFIVCIIGVPVTMLLNEDMYEASFIITTLCIMSCTTLTICLVFVPKIRKLVKSTLDENPPNEPSFKIRFNNETIRCTCECHVRSKYAADEVPNIPDVTGTRYLQDDIKELGPKFFIGQKPVKPGDLD
ncbi:gamma-aminobutyric acid type B receptor subunit 2 isoform X1 [Nematostella vectensis]|uniref:gamma-aminobutyric acid type B receptor subunit 2 isoform X1 n=1 Tax=Nematostella vectensis TaxID=45351 RepID=UPI0013902846|nr:gamma-aminobutyric acid type B receptor subunit 2 isoform X1 [Nematostella vectensis]XP_032234855.1 gamma-aminobutyric acid type B receptor subunit 2 isoform X1 [Nematostella vectensis]